MKKKYLAAFVAAMMIFSCLTACGDDSASNAEIPDSEVDMAVSEDSGSDDDEDDGEGESSESDADSDSSSEADSKSDSESDSKSDSSKSDSKTTAKSDGKSGTTKTTATTKKGQDGKQTTTTTATTAVEADDEPEEEVKQPKYIHLNGNSIQYEGEGISVNGTTCIIGAGGTYIINGILNNGQIYIQTDRNDKKKVKLHLNNVNITNSSGSVINCQCAKKLTVKSLPGTVNVLTDGGAHDADKGTIFSEDTVVLSGEGELHIKGNYAHGVQSDDDIIVNSGTININATKSCLHSNDGIEIKGGKLFCNGGTNGIKTDGYVTISGGSSVFIGGTREEKGAIYCSGVFSVAGGEFWAIGNACSWPDPSTTGANVIGLSFTESQPANTVVSVKKGGAFMFTMTSPNNFKNVLYCGPFLSAGATYDVSYGGSISGGLFDRYVYFNSLYNPANSGGSFTASGAVSLYTVTKPAVTTTTAATTTTTTAAETTATVAP